MKVLIVLAACFVACAYSRRVVINRVIDYDDSASQEQSTVPPKQTHKNGGHNLAGLDIGGFGVGLDTNLLGGESSESSEGSGNFVGLHLGHLKLGLNVGKTNNPGSIIGANVLGLGADVGTGATSSNINIPEATTPGDIFTAAGDLAAGAVGGVGQAASNIIAAKLALDKAIIGGATNAVGTGLQTVGHVASGLASGVGKGLHSLFSNFGRK